MGEQESQLWFQAAPCGQDRPLVGSQPPSLVECPRSYHGKGRVATAPVCCLPIPGNVCAQCPESYPICVLFWLLGVGEPGLFRILLLIYSK